MPIKPIKKCGKILNSLKNSLNKRKTLKKLKIENKRRILCLKYCIRCGVYPSAAYNSLRSWEAQVASEHPHSIADYMRIWVFDLVHMKRKSFWTYLRIFSFPFIVKWILVQKVVKTLWFYVEKHVLIENWIYVISFKKDQKDKENCLHQEPNVFEPKIN